MKIAVFTDLRFIESATPTGVGKHIVQMVSGLTRIPGNEISVLAARDQFHGKNLRMAGAPLPLGVRRLPLPWKAAEALWTLTGGPAADSYCKDVDWVYCPKNDFIPLRQKPLAVTVHGAHELDPQMPKPLGLGARLNRIRRRLSYRRITSGARLILVVSEFLKAQMIEWFACDAKKIAVVGNGVEQEFFEVAGLRQGASQRSLDRPYLLCVGGLNEIDGGQLVLDVARLLAHTHPDMQIVVAGLQNDAKYLTQARELPNVELPGYVPVRRLAYLMRDARALLYIPRYETFGIAAVEAMAAGTPVITTGGTAIPEVVGDAALYAPPNPHEVVDRITQIVGDDVLWKSLREAGRRRASNHTWEACVKRLNSALEGHSY